MQWRLVLKGRSGFVKYGVCFCVRMPQLRYTDIKKLLFVPRLGYFSPATTTYVLLKKSDHIKAIRKYIKTQLKCYNWSVSVNFLLEGSWPLLVIWFNLMYLLCKEYTFFHTQLLHSMQNYGLCNTDSTNDYQPVRCNSNKLCWNSWIVLVSSTNKK